MPTSTADKPALDGRYATWFAIIGPLTAVFGVWDIMFWLMFFAYLVTGWVDMESAPDIGDMGAQLTLLLLCALVTGVLRVVAGVRMTQFRSQKYFMAGHVTNLLGTLIVVIGPWGIFGAFAGAVGLFAQFRGDTGAILRALEGASFEELEQSGVLAPGFTEAFYKKRYTGVSLAIAAGLSWIGAAVVYFVA